ncbi:MAG TPA: UDP-2,3-diacylglucosamine diphosphatase [Casimicrobiaceae bacterium]|jgi:UDP-2,3-diacylglucosamine hydrolase|nr:UDP-2,3-diacylglucosamine diphosphatase [Casimicrobiaceae bacterium]
MAAAPTLFISDMHLARERSALVDALHALMRGPAAGAAALYALGDLFEVWVGDDQLKDRIASGVAAAFAALSQAGTKVYLQRGNRDFLLGERFARASGATLLADEVVHDLYGTPTLIMHGDQLCTDDVGYQRLRALWQDPARRRRAVATPYFARRGAARLMRAASRFATAGKSEAIMDVNADAVVAALRRHRVTRLIHGHTHRPARHELVVDGRKCERYVLADWYQRASYLRVDQRGCEAVTLS